MSKAKNEVALSDLLCRQRKYWRDRCIAAEIYISESPCDPDIYAQQILAYDRWKDIQTEKEPEA